MTKLIRNFKGGSLSSTSLMRDKNHHTFVRKTVSLIEDREYGFQRWYSQLKRLQRYSVLFPELFPKILKFGQEEKIAYFDMEYFKEAVNAQEYIQNANSSEVDDFFESLQKTLNKLHFYKIHSNVESIELYIHEEIEQRLNDCKKNQRFIDFLEYDEIIFNGNKVKPFMKAINEYKQMCFQFYTNPTETFTHGNITLENLLYIPKNKRVILIDPYEENIIDSVLCEYSQLLQSSNAKYEMFNERVASITANSILLELPSSPGMNYFNEKLLHYLKRSYSNDDYMIIRLMEISQFIRMLPFKMKIDEDKMLFFYGLASYLFSELKKEYNLSFQGSFK
jgi:ASC-1-like (ASCH) protein